MTFGFARGLISFVAIALLLSVNAFAEPGFEGISSSADAGYTRLIGLDANNNLVRDDIDDYIDRSYRDAQQHAAMIQFAQAYARLIVSGNTVAGAKHAAAGVVRAIQCGIKVFGDSNVARQKVVLAMMLNSRERFEAYDVARRNEEGQVLDRFQGEPCL
ncbi:hypothetical protein [Paraburkholderia caffeinilytica]|uniref:hypothetical protein n=1 Tax=Paraburkholderia caffeinilytica TaxID=1761016 RepID=UPI0038BA8B6E